MLSQLQIPEKKEKQLNRAGIDTLEKLLSYYPRKYQDRTVLTGIVPEPEESVFLFHAEDRRYVNARTPLIKVRGYDCLTNTPVHILWFNQAYLYDKLAEAIGKDILVAGKATFVSAGYGNPNRWEISSPAIFDIRGMEALEITPIYKKVPGMAEEYLRSCILKAAEILGCPEETIPEDVLQRNSLLAHKDMVAQLHWPSDTQSLEKAILRKRWDDLLYFALRIELGCRGGAVGSPFQLATIRKTQQLIQSLPFQLTADQDGCLRDMFRQVNEGKRLNALIQGDVGSGKTILAELLMMAFAENGYQTALMAPTQLLAKQHYDELRERMEPLGIEVAFVSGTKLRKGEQKTLESGIASGRYKMIVGTQALLSNTYQFKNLALVVVDEEHKYGVLQRKALTDKAAMGTHNVTMSATPIPRTLAQTIYGDHVQLYSIRTMPSGRLPKRTGIQPDMNRVLAFLRREIGERGHQAYVVCPMIAANEKMEGVATTEETYQLYKQALEPYGIQVGMVTGKTKKADAAQILDDFAQNKVSVLISTTVIEVGINVPNATCIIIHNAERFGLAQLHQLRGRVGRGKDQGWCILVSEETANERLNAMCQCPDGFQIAEMDLKLRGAGDFLGSQQSGTEKYLAMALAFPEEYAQAQKEAKWMLDSGVTCALLEKAVQDHSENVSGEMLE